MFNELFLFSVGVVVGAMNAIAGGGMMVGFPAMLALGVSPLVATATSYIIVIPGQITAIFGYRKYLTKIPRSYWLFLIPCLSGSVIGASLLKRTSPESFEQYVPALLGLAVLLFIVQPFIHFHFHRHLSKKTTRLLPVFLIALFLFPASIYGGYFGVGFGFAVLAFLGFTKLHDIHKINGLKNIATLAINAPAAILLSHAGIIDWKIGLIMAVGCAVGGYWGANVAQRFSSHVVRIVVICIGVIAVMVLAINTYSS